MSLFTWGLGKRGELGHTEIDRYGCCAMPTQVPLETPVAHVACGEGCTAAVTEDGGLLTWGSGRKGRLGHGTEEDERAPKPILGLAGIRVARVSVGEGHLGCVTEDQRAFVWGNGAGCALGQGGKFARGFSATPIPVVDSDGCPLNGVRDIACAFRYTGVLMGRQSVRREDGFPAGRDADGNGSVLLTWGDNTHGQLGLDHTDKTVPHPMVVTGLGEGVVSFSLGSLYAGACDASGRLHMWGYGGSGNLGQGNRRSHRKPQVVLRYACRF